jgi:hypothetical protein
MLALHPRTVPRTRQYSRHFSRCNHRFLTRLPTNHLPFSYRKSASLCQTGIGMYSPPRQRYIHWVQVLLTVYSEAYATLTFVNDLETLKQVQAATDAIYEQIRDDVPDLDWMFSYNPQPKVMITHSAARGGNSLGLQSLNHDQTGNYLHETLSMPVPVHQLMPHLQCTGLFLGGPTHPQTQSFSRLWLTGSIRSPRSPRGWARLTHSSTSMRRLTFRNRCVPLGPIMSTSS